MKQPAASSGTHHQGVAIPADGVVLQGDLDIPGAARGIVVFVHGSGSRRHSPRNQFVARALLEAGLWNVAAGPAHA